MRKMTTVKAAVRTYACGQSEVPDVDHGRTAVDGHACAGQKIWVQKKVRGTAQPKRSSRFRQSGDAASPALCLGCRNTIAA